jgi:hypothetical protein
MRWSLTSYKKLFPAAHKIILLNLIYRHVLGITLFPATYTQENSLMKFLVDFEHRILSAPFINFLPVA